MDVSSSYLSKKLLSTNDILLVWGGKRYPKFYRYCEILIVAVRCGQGEIEIVAVRESLFLPGRAFVCKATVMLHVESQLF